MDATVMRATAGILQVLGYFSCFILLSLTAILWITPHLVTFAWLHGKQCKSHQEEQEILQYVAQSKNQKQKAL